MELTLYELSKINILRLVHLAFCLLGALLIVFIWRTSQNSEKDDKSWGLLFIAFAFVLWAFIDFHRLIAAMKPGEISLVVKTFSVYNNAFFLSALPFFEKGFAKLRQRLPILNKPFTWIFYTLLFHVLIASLYGIAWREGSFMTSFIRYFDVFYSVITLGLLGYAMVHFFSKNQWKWLANICLGLTAALVIPQFAFMPFIHITHFDIISVLLLISHLFLVVFMVIIAQIWAFNGIITRLENEQSAQIKENENLACQIQNLASISQEQKQALATLNNSLIEKNLKLSESNIQSKIQLLSGREIEVLTHIDKSYLEIGSLLFISRDTVISHKKNIEMKLGIAGKENLVQFSKEAGLLQA